MTAPAGGTGGLRGQRPGGWAFPKTFPLLGGASAELVRGVCRQHAIRAGSPARGKPRPPAHLVGGFAGRAVPWAGWCTARVKAGQQDPLEEAAGFLLRVASNTNTGIDEFYQTCLRPPSIWISEVFTYQIVDKMILDGIIEGIGKGALGLGMHGAQVLRHAGDQRRRAMDSAGGCASRGRRCARSRAGRIQQYMVLTVAVVVWLDHFLLLVSYLSV